RVLASSNPGLTLANAFGVFQAEPLLTEFDIMKLQPARHIAGGLRLPGDKSISHRVALIAALGEVSSEISNFSTAADCASTLSCLRELGISIEQKQDKVVFAGGQELSAPRGPLDCGNSGSTLRMLAGVLAGHD